LGSDSAVNIELLALDPEGDVFLGSVAEKKLSIPLLYFAGKSLHQSILNSLQVGLKALLE
jgi:hypothetical protein